MVRHATVADKGLLVLAEVITTRDGYQFLFGVIDEDIELIGFIGLTIPIVVLAIGAVNIPGDTLISLALDEWHGQVPADAHRPVALAAVIGEAHPGLLSRGPGGKLEGQAITGGAV